MNNENYIVINGKKLELTEEQLKALGIEVEKKRTPFTRLSEGLYWSINAMGVVTVTGQHEDNDDFDNAVYDNVNYFNDYAFACQVALHQLLYRKLLKYAYENDAAVADCDWTSNAPLKKFYIIWSADKNKWIVDWHCSLKSNDVYFNKKKIAEQAIKDVIEPFMEEHPEFVW